MKKQNEESKTNNKIITDEIKFFKNLLSMYSKEQSIEDRNCIVMTLETALNLKFQGYYKIISTWINGTTDWVGENLHQNCNKCKKVIPLYEFKENKGLCNKCK